MICVGFFICLFLPYHHCTYAFVFYALCGSVSVVCICIRCQYCTNITRCFCNLSLGFCDLVLYLPLSFLSIFYRCICVLCLCLVFCVLCLCSVFCVCVHLHVFPTMTTWVICFVFHFLCGSGSAPPPPSVNKQAAPHSLLICENAGVEGWWGEPITNNKVI